MRLEKKFGPNLAGLLLVAHPAMLDQRFAKSVVLISVDSLEGATIGIVINNPMDKTVGDFDRRYIGTPLSEVPVYHGGPIGDKCLILTAWQWLAEEKVFKLYFGIPEEKAMELIENVPGIDLRAYAGYSGWNHCELESELQRHAWLLSSIKNLTPGHPKANLWRQMISVVEPGLLFLADRPQDPASN